MWTLELAAEVSFQEGLTATRVSDETIRATFQFLAWCCSKLGALGIRVLVMIWDNASWHLSKAVRIWMRQHNQQVKETGEGVRILVCLFPIKSPWLNPIEPKWLHAKRRVSEPNGMLSAEVLADRICATFGCAHEPHLSLSENAP